MIKQAIKVSVLFFWIFIYSLSFALNISSDIKLEEASKNSLKISFEEVPWAIWYYLYYDTKSVTDWNYSFEWSDIYDSNVITIQDLKPNTTYYLAVSVYDEDYKEWDLSKEFSFKTIWWSTDALQLENIEVVDTRTLKLEFNYNLDTNLQREFLISNKNYETQEINIIDSEIENWNLVFINLEKDLDILWEYSITILNLSWTSWETIEAWVDWKEDFIIPEDTPFFVEVTIDNNDINNQEDLNNDDNFSTWVVDSDEILENDLNSAWPEEIQSWSIGIDWQNLSNDDLAKTTVNATSNTEKLPSTWPESIILFFLAIIFWLIVFLFRKKEIK